MFDYWAIMSAMIRFEVVTMKNGKASYFSNLGLAQLDL